jgi:hypothetical protein
MQKVKHLAFWLVGSGVLAFVIGALLGGPDGGPGIYWGESGTILVAIGTGMLVVWFIKGL